MQKACWHIKFGAAMKQPRSLEKLYDLDPFSWLIVIVINTSLQHAFYRNRTHYGLKKEKGYLEIPMTTNRVFEVIFLNISLFSLAPI